MYQEERILHILQTLKTRTTLSNQEIMSMFGISRDTARRDIVKLVDEGVAVRTHGGITLPTLMTEIQTYHSREAQNLGVKQMLARRAGRYLASGCVLFLDVSTTVEQLCEHIAGDMIVYTHSIYNAERLMGSDCEVNILGGRLNRRNRFFAGGAALAQLDTVRFDVAFLGAAAVYGDGFYFSEREDAELKRKVAARSNFIVVIADDSKFARSAHYLGAAFPDVDVLVTNEPPPQPVQEAIERNGVSLDVWLPGADE